MAQRSDLGDCLAVIGSSTLRNPYKKTSDAGKVKSSERTKYSEVAVPHSCPIQQQSDAGIGCARNEIRPPDKLRQEAYI